MNKFSTIINNVYTALLGTPRYLRISLTKLLSKIQFHSGPLFLIYNLRGYRFNDTYTVLSTLQPGDILLRTYDNYVTSLLIPGIWCHAGIAIDNKTIIHAIGEGVEYVDVIKFCRTDKLCILRSNATTKQLKQVTALAKSQLGKPYDYDFIALNSSKFYCSELVAFCFASIFTIEPKATKIFGVIPSAAAITPSDVFACKDLNIVYNSLVS